MSPYALDQPGGVQDQVIEIGARLAPHGIEAWVVGPGLSGPEGARLLGSATTIPANGSRAPIALQPSILRRAAHAVEGADVVHVHEPLMPMVGWALLRGGGIPTVGTFHADPSSLIRSTYRRFSPIGRRMVKNLVGASAVSEVAASAVRPILPNLEIIPNGLDTAQYRSEKTRDPHRLAFIGRDEPRKGLDVLLAAWPAIRAVVPAATLDVIGAVRSEQIEGIRFLGRVDGPEKRRILTTASIFVAPNLGGESFGITLLEGMAAGCAVVASDLPAFMAVGESAVSFFPRGDTQALARRVTGFLMDEESLTMAADAAVRRSSFYDWATVLPAYILMYRSALSGH